MARKPELTELPTRLLLNALSGEGRQKRIFVVGIIGVVLLALGTLVAFKVIDSRAREARDTAWSTLNTCLLGQEPLKPNEGASARVTEVQLAVVGYPPERRGKPGELPWPASCGSVAFALGENASSPALREAAEALGKALKADQALTSNLKPAVDKLWAAAAADKLTLVAVPNATPAPKVPPVLFAGEALRTMPRFLGATFPLASVREEQAPMNKLRFLIDQKDLPEGPVLCTATSTDTAIRCAKIPETVATMSPGLRLIGTLEPGAQPFFFAGDRGQLGIFPPTGKHAIAASVAFGAIARADGSIAFLTRKGGKEVYLVSQPAVGATNEQVALQGTDVEAPTHAGLFWEWLVYRAAGKSPQHLVARKIEGTIIKGTNDIGELAEQAPPDKTGAEPQIHACKSDEAIAVRARGQRADAISFFSAGRWSSPIKADTRGGALTCRGVEAISTMVEHTADRDKDYPVITQARCNASGCTTQVIDMRKVLAGSSEIAPADAGSFGAADVAGKLLVVWNAGVAGGVRMRFALPERIKDADDIIITDGRDDKGEAKTSIVAQVRVISASSFGLIFLNTTLGVRVLRVDASGQLTPLGHAM